MSLLKESLQASRKLAFSSIVFLLATTLLYFPAASQETGFNPEDARATGNTEDVDAIKSTLRNLYTALALGDTAKYSSHVTEDYYVLEDGEYWSLEYCLSLVAKKTGTNYQRTDHLDFKIIEVYGNNAFAVWDLDAEIIRDGEFFNYSWLESASMKKLNGEWKVHVLHSTRR